MLLVSTFWGILGFHFQQNMWVTGGACVYLWTLSDRWKKKRKTKNKSTFLRNRVEPFPFEKKIWWLGQKPRNSGWFGQGHRLSLPPLVKQRLQLPTNKGQMVRIWLHEQRPHETSRPTWEYETFLHCEVAWLIMLHEPVSKFIHKKTRHVDLKKTIHNEKPWKTKALKDFAHRFPWQGFQASNFSMQGWEVGLNCFLKFLSDLLFWWFFIALLCTK